jgi:Tfp pilus assembly protein PilE
MRSVARPRGFTLIEAMVVAIGVGILATLAVTAYRRWVQSSYLAEAQDMVSNIRAAQESFRAENGGYVNMSTGLGVGYDYPLAKPGKSKTAWGGPCAMCTNANAGWSALAVTPSGPVAFGYSSIASNGASDPTPVQKPTLSVNGKTLDLSGVKQPWYVVEADGDHDGNGVYCNVFGFSSDPKIYVNAEGE